MSNMHTVSSRLAKNQTPKDWGGLKPSDDMRENNIRQVLGEGDEGDARNLPRPQVVHVAVLRHVNGARCCEQRLSNADT
jgi:hypothetical protein